VKSSAASSLSVAVLGGGITGLAAAYRLSRLGHCVRLFEQGPQVGGAIRTERTDGWLIEGGPNSFQEAEPEVTALLNELGLAGERVEANPLAKNRYLVRNGRLVAVPSSPSEFLRSPLFSTGAKARIFMELLTRRRDRKTDVSLAAFVRLHLGQEILDYAVQPFVAGIYAGDPEKLSARHAFPKLWQMERTHGSLLRAQIAEAKTRRARGETAIAKIISFRRGLQALADALAAALPAGAVAVNARVESLLPGPPWRVIWHDGESAHTEEFDRVISALPASALARVTVGTLGERPLAMLENIVHPPLSSLFLGYRREQVAHPLDGFGALVPAKERRAFLGVLFSSSLFVGRAPDGHVALTVMVGGAQRPELATQPTDALLATVRRDLQELLGATGEPALVRHTFWPRAIPQYNLGHERYLEAMAARERANPGLFIGGNARDGIALPACLQAGLRLAARAAAPAALGNKL
jgi:oxygen-dependent protoporphyrinogen oxidase